MLIPEVTCVFLTSDEFLHSNTQYHVPGSAPLADPLQNVLYDCIIIGCHLVCGIGEALFTGIGAVLELQYPMQNFVIGLSNNIYHCLGEDLLQRLCTSTQILYSYSFSSEPAILVPGTWYWYHCI